MQAQTHVEPHKLSRVLKKSQNRNVAATDSECKMMKKSARINESQSGARAHHTSISC